MNKKLLTLFVSFACLTLSPIQACSEDGHDGFMEKNDMWISVHEKAANNMTEEVFNTVLDRLETIYTPIIEAKKKKFVINRKWENGTVNASAQQSGRTWTINMFGGLARSPVVTADGFALVACHELGHHLGGAPKRKSFFSTSWASNEGQSDYWGSMKCFRKYMELDNNQEIVATMTIPESITNKCLDSFANAEDHAMCIRGSMAGISLASLLGGLQTVDSSVISVDTPDQSTVKKTNDRHPAAQCRLDTYYAGSLCIADHYTDTDDKDANKNVCSRKAGDITGIRPLCWYKNP
jgi:hypothetical protein